MTINWKTIENRCESTPFVICEFPNGNLRLWWSKRAGAYGFQVYGFAVIHGNSLETDKKTFVKSNGCGYCKESHILAQLFKFLGFKPQGMGLDSEGIPHQYKIGGNYYKIPADKMEPIV